MLSKSSLCATKGTLNCGIYSSIRSVHWYHDTKLVGATRDNYELFNRQREFGQGEIDDTDRYPHLYWNVWKGRTHLQRVVQQWGYSKDHKPEYLRREAEKMAYFMKLDDLDFLEQTRPEYNYIDDDAKNAVGYITDDEDDEIMEHTDYGAVYSDASDEYREMILEDHCDGRPVYEWQVPYGLECAFGYKSVETAVDIICNENALENIQMEWVVYSSGDVGKGLLLQNQNTQQEICLIDSHDAASLIKTWNPSTVVIQSGAEKLLSQMKSTFAPTNRTDVYGCSISVVWSVAWLMSPLWPANALLSAATAAGLLGLNGSFLYRTFLHPQDQTLKKVFGATKEMGASLVLGDWLLEDYDERLNQVTYFDDLASNVVSGQSLLGVGSDALSVKGETRNVGTFNEFVKNVKDVGSGSMLHHKTLPPLGIDDVNGEWCKSYRDAVNNRRIDLLAQVLNNCEGDKILMSVDGIDNITAPIVTQLLQRRLTGEAEIKKPVLKYDTYYERVQVDI
eukprot:41797_1